MRINIGCGMTPTAGWQNFDNSFSLKLSKYPTIANLLSKAKLINRPEIDYIRFCQKNSIKWADATQNIPLPDESVELVYSSHMIEHLDRDEASRFLNEAKRILKSGGIIRLAVPDIKKKVEAYLFNNDADAFIESTYMCIPRPRSAAQKLRMALVGSRHHLWMYDGKSLSGLLQRHGFAQVTILAAGETTIPDPAPLDLREREEESLYVEAVRNP